MDAGEVLAAADEGREGLDLERLKSLLAQPDELARLVEGRTATCSRLTEALAVAAERMQFAPALVRHAA